MRRLLERIGRVAALAPRERADLFRAQWAILVARLQLSTRRTGSLVRGGHDDGPIRGRSDPAAAARAARTALTEVDAARARTLDRAIQRAAAHGPVRTTCLLRAAALQRLLERDGITGSRLRVGVRRLDGEFAAHAWVELGGMVLGDQSQHVRSFSPTDLQLVRR